MPEGAQRRLRFASADYSAEVFLDGTHVGTSSAAMLPFELDITELTIPGEQARLVVQVSNLLPVDGPTQRVTEEDYRTERRPRDEYLPAVRFDFFPYGGLNRPVHVLSLPTKAIGDYRVETAMDGTVRAEVTASAGSARP